MPSWMGSGIPLHERPTRQLVLWIVLCPIVGAAMIVFGVYLGWRHRAEFAAIDWLLQVAWMIVVGVVIAGGLPAVALQELRRRH